MKKIVLATLLASGLMAEGTYMGIDMGSVSNTTTYEVDGFGVDVDNAYSDFKLKLGSGTDGGVKFQGYISAITYDDPVFGGQNNPLIEVGVDIIKEFEAGNDFYPYLKAGLGIGSMTVDSPAIEGDSMTEVSFNLGAGLSYKIDQTMYLIVGIDIIGRAWEALKNDVGDTMNVTDAGTKSYVGINFAF